MSESLSVNPMTSMIMMYENDILDCIYIDMDDKFGVISPHQYPNYDDLADTLEEAGATVMSVGMFDPEAGPHCYIIKSVTRLIVAEAEGLLD